MADRGDRTHEQWGTYLTSFCQMSKNKTPRLWRRFTKKNKLTQWGSHILTSILTSHMMVTKNPQNVHRNYVWAILLTFIFDIKIDINICEPHYVNLLFFLWTSSIVCMFDFLIFDIFSTAWHLFDILTHQLNWNHLSPHRANFFKWGSKYHTPAASVREWQFKSMVWTHSLHQPLSHC